MHIHEDTRRDLEAALGRVRRAIGDAQAILNTPSGRRVENLEDAFNLVNDTAFQARSAFGSHRQEFEEVAR